MLFRCLHPMELDTGPWPKKPSMLCSLLLLLATFFVLQIPGQAEIVGLGNHTLMKDGELMLNMDNDYTYIGVKNINLTEYKQIFPGACDIQIKDDLIELQYNGTLCTVDLLSDLKDKIEFKVGVRNEAGLIDCLKSETSVNASYSNLLPFIYSKNNEEIKKFSKGDNLENSRNNKCGNPEQCNKIGGECLEWTSLEVSWSRVDRVAFGHIHSIAEVKSNRKQSQEFGNRQEVTLDLEINEKGMFRMKKRGSYFEQSERAICAPDENSTVIPAAWTITNTRMEKERLLVFSLLSLNASNVFDGESFIEKPKMPKCELFIQFNTTYYRLLTVILPPTTTTSTTTQTTTTTTTEAPSTTTTSCPTLKTEPVTTTTKGPTTERPVEKKCPEESKTSLYVALGIGWLLFVLMLLAVGILTWFSIKKTDNEKEAKMPEQAKDKYLRALYDAEVKKKGPAAVGTFDKWKENRKKNEKTAAQGLPSKRDGNTANKKKTVKEAKTKSKNDIVQEKYEKEWYQYLYNSEYLPELKKKGIAVVGTFDEWKKNRPPPAATTMIEQSPMTKTAMGTDKSVVDKGKSSTGVDGKKSATVEDIVQPFAEDPVIPDPPKKAEKVKDEEWTLEENEYDDDGNLLPKVEKGGIECPQVQIRSIHRYPSECSNERGREGGMR